MELTLVRKYAARYTVSCINGILKVYWNERVKTPQHPLFDDLKPRKEKRLHATSKGLNETTKHGLHLEALKASHILQPLIYQALFFVVISASNDHFGVVEHL